MDILTFLCVSLLLFILGVLIFAFAFDYYLYLQKKRAWLSQERHHLRMEYREARHQLTTWIAEHPHLDTSHPECQELALTALGLVMVLYYCLPRERVAYYADERMLVAMIESNATHQ